MNTLRIQTSEQSPFLDSKSSQSQAQYQTQRLTSPSDSTLFTPKTDQNQAVPVTSIPIEEITPNRSQPRRNFDAKSLQTLADSIKTHGILQPITVQKLPTNSEYSTFKYEIIAGERRLRAARSVGLVEIPAIVMDISEQESAELAIIENLHREDLGIFEEAAAIAALIELHNLTQEEIAKQLSLTQSAIANKLRLLKLTDEEKALIISSNLTERHARALLKLKDINIRKAALEYITSNELNVKQSEAYIERLLSPQITPQTHDKTFKSYISSIQKTIQAIRNTGSNAKTSYSETDNEFIYTIIISKQLQAD